MKKSLLIFFVSIIFCSKTFAETYYFKECIISNNVKGDYIINVKKNIIEVQIKSADGKIQSLENKIKLIDQDSVASNKIKSPEGEDIYYQYFLNSRSKSITQIKYKKATGADINVYTMLSKTETFCNDIKANWDKAKIDKNKIKKEQKEIVKAQEKIKKEQSSLNKCQGKDHNQWNNCKGLYKSKTNHIFNGLFVKGAIIKGISIYPGGSKYVGDFKNYKPHGYGTFIWANGDKYYGEWRDGKNNGNGTKVWKNGRKYSGQFKNDELHGNGTLFYPEGEKYEGEFLNGKRHGEGTFTYADGSAYIGNFVSGKEEGTGECINKTGENVPCIARTETKNINVKKYADKDTRNISLEAKKWIRISQYEANTKRGKKVMDKLKNDFEIKASELCSSKGNYNVLEKRLEVLEVDETPAYGLETKLKIGINGSIECK